METIYLQSMTDFVLGIAKQTTMEGNLLVRNFNKIKNYAKFLKQPLKLEMFVPCHEGKPLEEPQMRPERNSFDEEDMDYDAQELYEYIEAKKKVLFENFKEISAIKHHIEQGRNIEYFCQFKENLLILTDSAIKQISL